MNSNALAVVLVGSRLGDHVDHAAHVSAILRAEIGRLDAELADRIGEGIGQVAVGHVVLVVAAIEPPEGGVASAAGDRNRDGLVGVLAAGKVAAGAVLEPPEAVIRRVICRPLSGISVTAFVVDGLLEGGVFGLQRQALRLYLDLHAQQRRRKGRH